MQEQRSLSIHEGNAFQMVKELWMKYHHRQGKGCPIHRVEVISATVECSHNVFGIAVNSNGNRHAGDTLQVEGLSRILDTETRRAVLEQEEEQF